MIALRGHHVLCLLGYQGMGYSKEYIANMTQVHRRLRTYPKTEIILISGPDDLCAKFPESQPYHCEDTNIHERDASILEQLQLSPGQVLPWEEIEERIKEFVLSTDIARLCSTCSWRSCGVCEEGVVGLKSGKGLRLVE